MLAHLGLGHVAQWEEDPRQAIAVEVIEHVGLVLRGVRRGMQLRAVDARHDSRVVAGGEPVESHLQDTRQHEVEPHEGVAPHAWIGRPALEVVAVEGLDHPLPEILLQVPAVIRNA